MNESNILPYFHVFITLYYLYPLAFSKSMLWDKIYLIVIMIVVLNWTVLKGECLLSYIWKTMKDKNYKMGTNTLDLNDIKDLLPFFDEKFVSGSFALFILFVFLIFGYTANRSNILSLKLCLLFISSSTYVLLRERKFFNKKIYDSLKKHYILDTLNISTVLIILYLIIRVMYA